MKTNNYFLHIILTMVLFYSGTKTFAYDLAVENADGVTIYYTYSNNNTELMVTFASQNYNSYYGEVNIPAKVTYNNKNLKVKYIGAFAFKDCKYLTSVTIPNSVESIGASSFRNCKSLTSITIPNSVTRIDEYAFADCSGLTSIITGDAVNTIGKDAFSNCSSLNSFIIPNSITTIERNTFANCTSLCSVTIPNSVEWIGNSSFWNCRNLTSVSIPNSVTGIGETAFYGCSGLTIVKMGSSVNTILNSAFGGCTKIEKLIITDIATWCGATFKDVASRPHCQHIYSDENTEITDLIIPSSVTRIEMYAFDNCKGLKSVKFPNSLKYIGKQSFFSCSSLTNISIPNSVEVLDASSFGNCTNLKSLTIGKSVKIIETMAFAPSENLNEVYCLAKDVPNTNTSAFHNPQIATLYVPEVSLTQYETTMPWSQFGTILPIDDVSGIEYCSNNELRVFSCNGLINISGLDESKQIAIYQTDGKQVATAKAYNGSASVATNISKGTPVIVKIGEKAVKVVMQ